MQDQDRKEFSEILSAAWSLYDRTPTEAVLGMFWHTLKRYPLAVVANAISYHIADPERGRFYPKPADIMHQAAPAFEQWRLRQQVPIERRLEYHGQSQEEQAEEHRRTMRKFRGLVSDLAKKKTMSCRPSAYAEVDPHHMAQVRAELEAMRMGKEA